jgi:hypothetical protein
VLVLAAGDLLQAVLDVDEVAVDFFGGVVLALDLVLELAVVLDEALVDLDEGIVPLLGLERVDDCEYLGAELVVGAFLVPQLRLQVEALPFHHLAHLLVFLDLLAELEDGPFLLLELLVQLEQLRLQLVDQGFLGFKLAPDLGGPEVEDALGLFEGFDLVGLLLDHLVLLLDRRLLGGQLCL